jgi:hypothetical protein
MEYAKQWGMPLDRGIAYAVKVLRDGGIETFESCEGGAGHAFLEPTVRFHGGTGVGFLAVARALECGLPLAELRRSWRVADGELEGPFWELTFPRERLLVVQEQAEVAGLIK